MGVSISAWQGGITGSGVGQKSNDSALDIALAKHGDYLAAQKKEAKDSADDILRLSRNLSETSKYWQQIVAWLKLTTINGAELEDWNRFGNEKNNPHPEQKELRERFEWALQKLDWSRWGEPDSYEKFMNHFDNEGELVDRKLKREDVEQIVASVEAYFDGVQVTIDAKQQKFKNTMTQVNSAQEEIRDLRRTITNLCKR